MHGDWRLALSEGLRKQGIHALVVGWSANRKLTRRSTDRYREVGFPEAIPVSPGSRPIRNLKPDAVRSHCPENLLNRVDALARPLVEIPGEAFEILFVRWFFH